MLRYFRFVDINIQTKSRQCRGKEEESDTACCIGTPEHCGLVRRDLVVCPPFWLLPRIETGDSFLWACCAPLLRPHPQGNVPAWAFAGRTFRRLWGMSVPFSLSAPLLCQIIVAILCGNFEQFANKRPHGWMPQCKNRPGFLLWKPRRFIMLYSCFLKPSRDYLRGFLIAAWAAARRAIGTRKGEQLT